MANIKNLSTERYKAHEFLSEFAEHVGEDKLNDDGRMAKFRKRKRFMDTNVSELMAEAQQRRDVIIEQEKTERQQFAGYMKQKKTKDKYAPKDY